MKVLICGSRYLSSPEDMWMLATAVEDSGFEITEIISGMAEGIDSLAVRLARKWNIPTSQHPALWDKWGKGAGFIRNTEMIQETEACIAVIWLQAKCNGTRHSIKLAHLKGIPTYVVWVD